MHGIKKAMFFFSLFLLMGCSARQEEVDIQEPETALDSMEEEPDLVYEVPVSTPNILVNQLGYITGGTKTAIFRSEEMPGEFHVVRVDDQKVVFTGSSDNGEYDADTKEYYGYGDFSDLCEPGHYYVEAPFLGRSYSFRIEDGLYDEIFKEACRQYYYHRCAMDLLPEYAGEKAHDACHTEEAFLREDPAVCKDVSGGWHQDEEGFKSVTSAARNMSVLLLAYELYQDVFTDDMGIPESGNEIPDLLDEIRYEAEWMLKMQDEERGTVYAGITFPEPGEKGGKIYVEEADFEAAMAFAAALAKFSYSYQDYDAEFASECLLAARRAFDHAGEYEEKEADDWEFAAAAELYRMLGKQSLHTVISEYLSEKNYAENLNEISFLGGVTYISTRGSVKINLCQEIADALMTRAENIAEQARGFVFQTKGNADENSHRDLLREMMYLTMIDHMITNYEYGTVIENHLHYFMGRNEAAISYIDNVGEKNYKLISEEPGIMEQLDTDSMLIFMVSEIVHSYRNEKP